MRKYHYDIDSAHITRDRGNYSDISSISIVMCALSISVTVIFPLSLLWCVHYLLSVTVIFPLSLLWCVHYLYQLLWYFLYLYCDVCIIYSPLLWYFLYLYCVMCALSISVTVIFPLSLLCDVCTIFIRYCDISNRCLSKHIDREVKRSKI